MLSYSASRLGSACTEDMSARWATRMCVLLNVSKFFVIDRKVEVCVHVEVCLKLSSDRILKLKCALGRFEC
jgi:hypothetical protein